MNKNLILLSIIGAVMLLFMVGVGSAVDCFTTGNIINSSSISNGCLINSAGYYTMSGETFNLNGSFTGAIQLGSNVVVDCNSSIIKGNFTTGEASTNAGFYATSKNNITIMNCNIQNFSYGIRIRNTPNLIIKNNNVSSNRESVILDTNPINSSIFSNILKIADKYVLDVQTYGRNINIFNNTMGDSSLQLVLITNVNNISVYNNYFYDNSNLKASMIDFTNVSNLDYYNNNATHIASMFYAQDKLINFSIHDNYSFNSTNGWALKFIDGIENGRIYNNSIKLCDKCLSLEEGGKDIFIYNNTITDSYTMTGNSSMGISIRGNRTAPFTLNYTNVQIYNNNISNFGCFGIFARDLFDSSIYNNTITYNFNYVNSQMGNSMSCVNEPITGIFIGEVLFGYIPLVTPSFINYSDSSIHYSNNISILGNVITGTSVILRTQGIRNLVSDLSNYWFRSFQIPEFMNKDDFYGSNQYNNFSTVVNGNNIIILQQGRGLNSYYNWWYNYSINKDYSYFERLNESYGSQLNVYNNTNSLIYFSNGSIPSGCSIISSCDGNINITLTPSNYSYILDNFNLTESVSRQNSPIWFSSSTSTEKHIASNLTQAINATVVTNIGDCTTKNLLTYTTDSGVKTTWRGDNAKTICEQLKTTGVVLTIEPAQNSNELAWEDGSTDLSNKILKILIGFLALAVMIFAVAGFMIYAKDNFQNISVTKFTEYSVLLLLFTIMIIILINYIADVI